MRRNQPAGQVVYLYAPVAASAIEQVLYGHLIPCGDGGQAHGHITAVQRQHRLWALRRSFPRRGKRPEISRTVFLLQLALQTANALHFGQIALIIVAGFLCFTFCSWGYCIIVCLSVGSAGASVTFDAGGGGEDHQSHQWHK